MQAALELCNILSESGTNLRQPVGLESQLLKDKRMDSDVGKSMLQLLQVCILIPLLCTICRHEDAAYGETSMVCDGKMWICTCKCSSAKDSGS